MAARKQKAGRQRKRMPARTVEDEDYQLRHERVAGIDVAKASGMVCLRLPPQDGKGKRRSKVWETGATVPEIEAAAEELLVAGVELISMESTSDYWRIWFVTLEAAGLKVQLVNASQARNLPGRPKTDVDDAQWIARLTEMGMLRPSFVPPPEIRALRQYTRQLAHLTQDRTRCWQRLDKTPEDALCKLTLVISKLAGSVSARAMIEAMIAGQRDPEALAGMALTRMQGKWPALIADPAARYRDLGPDHYAKHADTGRKVRGHIRQLEALGLDVTVTPREEAA